MFLKLLVGLAQVCDQITLLRKEKKPRYFGRYKFAAVSRLIMISISVSQGINTEYKRLFHSFNTGSYFLI